MKNPKMLISPDPRFVYPEDTMSETQRLLDHFGYVVMVSSVPLQLGGRVSMQKTLSPHDGDAVVCAVSSVSEYLEQAAFIGNDRPFVDPNRKYYYRFIAELSMSSLFAVAYMMR